MTAVASPPTLSQHNRPAWGMNGHRGVQSIDAMNPDELNRMFMPRKSLQRNNSSSSISSTSSTSTVVGPNNGQQPQTNGANTNGAPMSIAGDLGSWSSANANALNANAANAANAASRKRPQEKAAPWPTAKTNGTPMSEFTSMVRGRPQLMGSNGSNPGAMQPSPVLQSQPQMSSQHGSATGSALQSGQPVLYLLSLNGTFERKTISVPFSPDTLRIGRQTNAKTVPTPTNGFFDSKVLSRQHAEIWADRQGKIWIRDVKSSNGTFVNGTRLSQENRESEPHELQTGDHLELGIDIVSEDQKTVVHHKVAAKVEHSGFLNPSSNLLDMNFGDLDPSNAMMMQNSGGLPFRARTGSQASVANNSRIMPSAAMMAAQPSGVPQQRAGFFFSPITTETIVKKLKTEMRTARLQTQDLGRANHFVHTLLSRDDIKDMEKPDVSEAPRHQMTNGNGVPFMRNDNKTRFSDPPAPPPQQPLPEKPDVPSLKRGITERPKTSVSSTNVSPIRQDGNVSQILHLTEALNNARKELETQTSKMRDLEEKLNKEREARELAEELARRLEEAAASKMNGAAVKSQGDEEPTLILDATFEPPLEVPTSPDADTPTSDLNESSPAAPQVENIEASAAQLHNQLESMVLEMKDLRQQLEVYKTRAETAEAERDADRKTLSELILQARQDAEKREAVVRAKSQSRVSVQVSEKDDGSVISEESAAMVRTSSTNSSTGTKQATPAGPHDAPTLSRANTITPFNTQAGQLAHSTTLESSMPYASMLGVVLLGMGLMAYINGWQSQPPRLDR